MFVRLRSHVGALLVVAALLLGSGYYYQVTQETSRANCQARYNTAFATNLILRSQLSGIRQDAEDALLATVSTLVLHPPVTTADKAKAATAYVAAFQTYQEAAAAYTAAKTANPLPAIPNCR